MGVLELKDVRDRAQYVINAASMRVWIASKTRDDGWRDIVRRAVAVYEDRFGVRWEYQFFDESGRPGVDVEELTMYSQESADRTLKQLNRSCSDDHQLFIHRRLVGKWFKVA